MEAVPLLEIPELVETGSLCGVLTTQQILCVPSPGGSSVFRRHYQVYSAVDVGPLGEAMRALFMDFRADMYMDPGVDPGVHWDHVCTLRFMGKSYVLGLTDSVFKSLQQCFMGWTGGKFYSRKVMDAVERDGVYIGPASVAGSFYPTVRDLSGLRQVSGTLHMDEGEAPDLETVGTLEAPAHWSGVPPMAKCHMFVMERSDGIFCFDRIFEGSFVCLGDVLLADGYPLSQTVEMRQVGGYWDHEKVRGEDFVDMLHEWWTMPLSRVMEVVGRARYQVQLRIYTHRLHGCQI